MVLTHAMWQQRFHGDRDIVGKTLTLDRTPTTVIGVLPQGFDVFGARREFFLPLCLTRAQSRAEPAGTASSDA